MNMDYQYSYLIGDVNVLVLAVGWIFLEDKFRQRIREV